MTAEPIIRPSITRHIASTEPAEWPQRTARDEPVLRVRDSHRAADSTTAAQTLSTAPASNEFTDDLADIVLLLGECISDLKDMRQSLDDLTEAVDDLADRL